MSLPSMNSFDKLRTASGQRIVDAFRPGHKALIAYVTVGYPSLEATVELVPRLAEAGCDMVELGIPFSDPLADGATIQRASYEALRQGVTPAQCLEVAARLRPRTHIPLLFMTYYNPVVSYGLEDFCHDSFQSGVSGLIVPDLPPEEGGELEDISREHGVNLVYLLAPTSSDERIDLVAKHSRGFIYLVSLAGVTGARDSLPPDLEAFVGRVRQRTSLPLCVGFGIASPEQARRVCQVADGAIVGSRIIQLEESEKGSSGAVEFVRSLRTALDGIATPT